MKIATGYRDFSSDDEESWVTLGDADPRDVMTVIAADDSEDGRSQWVWMRFPNGDLFLACCPQGDTYFGTEARRIV